MLFMNKIGIGFIILGTIIWIIGYFCKVPDIGKYGDEYIFSLRNTLQVIGINMVLFSLLFFAPPN